MAHNNISIFTGSRNLEFTVATDRAIRTLLSKSQTGFVGDCPTGLDRLVRNVHIDFLNVKMHIGHAFWETYGKAAGPIRNERMVLAALALSKLHPGTHLACYAWPSASSVGTRDCMRAARAHNIPVIEL